MPAFLYALIFVGYIVAPCALIWSWVQWAKQPRGTNIAAHISFIGLLFATASALLAIGTHIYARAIGGFPFYDPRLLRIYRYGLLLSLIGVVSGLTGLAKKSSTRWLSPVSAFGTLIYWFCAASSE
jgi:hypothetical protein